MLVNLIIQLVAGAIGGNAVGAAAKDMSLGSLGNTIAGAIGGGVGGQILTALIPMLSGAAAGGVDLGALAGQAVGGGVAGAIFVALYTVLLNYGEMTVSAGAASFIINVNPIITAVLAMILLGERFPALAWAGTFLSFTGIGIIALGEGQGLTFNTGALLILGSALCTSINSIVQKRLFSRHRPLTVSAWNMILGALCLAPALPSGIAQMAAADAEPFWSVIYLGIVPSLIAYASWSVALSRLPASRASNFMYCVPPVAVLIGFVWLGETPGLFGITGGALALAGVVLDNLKR